MKHSLKIIMLILFAGINFHSDINAQDMNNQKLYGIIYTLSDQIEGENGSWRFSIDSTLFICLTDELHNRMRIISPIQEMSKVSAEQINRCMQANFHSALDVKYAISDDILWSVFIHPLQELSKEQVISGISQVYSCANTFGSEYSGGSLSFPTEEERDAKKN